MKINIKITVIIILSILTFSYLKGQKICEIKQFTGITISNVYFSDYRDNGGTYAPYTGQRYDRELKAFSTGFQVSYLKHKFWHLNTRLSYMERGGSEKLYLVNMYYERTGEIEYNKFITNYLSLNTTFELKNYTKIVNQYIFIGPRYDYLFSTNYYYSKNSSYKTLNKDNYGFDLGIGIDKTINGKYLIGLDLFHSSQIKNISHHSYELNDVKILPGKCISMLLCIGMKL